MNNTLSSNMSVSYMTITKVEKENGKCNFVRPTSMKPHAAAGASRLFLIKVSFQPGDLAHQNTHSGRYKQYSLIKVPDLKGDLDQRSRIPRLFSGES